ncbi:hypothetical protein BLNAU_1532 [Blattamonas nauphoetae]|uniref:Uncharacterized protein n=1 Tax=Blattamonas nauphoetae TaxID=2049346 RepID=A0ABQ9YIA9_9EUKA|nr:hypothetical protein BLNAU_1532 [Blattamonas nauphoetae]
MIAFWKRPIPLSVNLSTDILLSAPSKLKSVHSGHVPPLPLSSQFEIATQYVRILFVYVLQTERSEMNDFVNFIFWSLLPLISAEHDLPRVSIAQLRLLSLDPEENSVVSLSHFSTPLKPLEIMKEAIPSDNSRIHSPVLSGQGSPLTYTATFSRHNTPPTNLLSFQPLEDPSYLRITPHTTSHTEYQLDEPPVYLCPHHPSIACESQLAKMNPIVFQEIKTQYVQLERSEGDGDQDSGDLDQILQHGSESALSASDSMIGIGPSDDESYQFSIHPSNLSLNKSSGFYSGSIPSPDMEGLHALQQLALAPQSSLSDEAEELRTPVELFSDMSSPSSNKNEVSTMTAADSTHSVVAELNGSLFTAKRETPNPFSNTSLSPDRDNTLNNNHFRSFTPTFSDEFSLFPSEDSIFYSSQPEPNLPDSLLYPQRPIAKPHHLPQLALHSEVRTDLMSPSATTQSSHSTDILPSAHSSFSLKSTKNQTPQTGTTQFDLTLSASSITSPVSHSGTNQPSKPDVSRTESTFQTLSSIQDDHFPSPSDIESEIVRSLHSHKTSPHPSDSTPSRHHDRSSYFPSISTELSQMTRIQSPKLPRSKLGTDSSIHRRFTAPKSIPVTEPPVFSQDTPASLHTDLWNLELNSKGSPDCTSSPLDSLGSGLTDLDPTGGDQMRRQSRLPSIGPSEVFDNDPSSGAMPPIRSHSIAGGLSKNRFDVTGFLMSLENDEVFVASDNEEDPLSGEDDLPFIVPADATAITSERRSSAPASARQAMLMNTDVHSSLFKTLLQQSNIQLTEVLGKHMNDEAHLEDRLTGKTNFLSSPQMVEVEDRLRGGMSAGDTESSCSIQSSISGASSVMEEIDEPSEDSDSNEDLDELQKQVFECDFEPIEEGHTSTVVPKLEIPVNALKGKGNQVQTVLGRKSSAIAGMESIIAMSTNSEGSSGLTKGLTSGHEPDENGPLQTKTPFLFSQMEIALQNRSDLDLFTQNSPILPNQTQQDTKLSPLSHSIDTSFTKSPRDMQDTTPRMFDQLKTMDNFIHDSSTSSLPVNASPTSLKFPNAQVASGLPPRAMPLQPSNPRPTGEVDKTKQLFRMRSRSFAHTQQPSKRENNFSRQISAIQRKLYLEKSRASNPLYWYAPFHANLLALLLAACVDSSDNLSVAPGLKNHDSSVLTIIAAHLSHSENRKVVKLLQHLFETRSATRSIALSVLLKLLSTIPFPSQFYNTIFNSETILHSSLYSSATKPWASTIIYSIPPSSVTSLRRHDRYPFGFPSTDDNQPFLSSVRVSVLPDFLAVLRSDPVFFSLFHTVAKYQQIERCPIWKIFDIGVQFQHANIDPSNCGFTESTLQLVVITEPYLCSLRQWRNTLFDLETETPITSLLKLQRHTSTHMLFGEKEVFESLDQIKMILSCLQEPPVSPQYLLSAQVIPNQSRTLSGHLSLFLNIIEAVADCLISLQNDQLYVDPFDLSSFSVLLTHGSPSTDLPFRLAVNPFCLSPNPNSSHDIPSASMASFIFELITGIRLNVFSPSLPSQLNGLYLRRIEEAHAPELTSLINSLLETSNTPVLLSSFRSSIQYLQTCLTVS